MTKLKLKATADLLDANADGCNALIGIATRASGRLDRFHLGGLSTGQFS